jgi:glycosyl transferase-like sugar-binding protein
MDDTVWLYWEGPQPPYISLCLKTVRVHHPNARVLDRAAFDALFRSDRDLDIDALALNHKSDFIRAYLLAHYGGLYVDADCIVLRSLGPVLEMAGERGFAGYREPLGYMSCNFMAASAGSAVIADHYERVCARLRSGKPLEWLDLASVPMDQAVVAHPEEYCLIPTEQVMPLSWTKSHELCIQRSDEEHSRYVREDAFCYMLSNNTIKSRLKTRILCYMPEDHLLAARYFISYLFRRALTQGVLDVSRS